jgi:hypothetical protein
MQQQCVKANVLSPIKRTKVWHIWWYHKGFITSGFKHSRTFRLAKSTIANTHTFIRMNEMVKNSFLREIQLLISTKSEISIKIIWCNIINKRDILCWAVAKHLEKVFLILKVIHFRPVSFTWFRWLKLLTSFSHSNSRHDFTTILTLFNLNICRFLDHGLTRIKIKFCKD